MFSTSIDTSELKYLKSCRDKLLDIGDMLKNKDKNEDEEEKSAKEKLLEIKQTLKG